MSELALGHRLRTAKAVCGLPRKWDWPLCFVLWGQLSLFPDFNLGQTSGEIQGRYMDEYRGGTWKNTG